MKAHTLEAKRPTSLAVARCTAGPLLLLLLGIGEMFVRQMQYGKRHFREALGAHWPSEVVRLIQDQGKHRG
jgi:hypothetical protein